MRGQANLIAALSAGLELGEGGSRYRIENVLPRVNGLLDAEVALEWSPGAGSDSDTGGALDQFTSLDA